MISRASRALYSILVECNVASDRQQKVRFTTQKLHLWPNCVYRVTDSQLVPSWFSHKSNKNQIKDKMDWT